MPKFNTPEVVMPFDRISRSAALTCVLALAVLVGPALAVPTLINYAPTVDTIAKDTLMLQLSYYKFNFKDDASKAAIKEDGSWIYSLGYGFKKAEIGVDVIGDKSFTNMDSALYAGPTAWNVKYRLLTQGQGHDTFSLAIGAYNLGVKEYTQDFYGPAPYIMAAKSFDGFRLHLGYQFNILGYKRLDTDRKRNNDFLAGFDAVIIKHKTNPVSVYIDYTGGPGKMIGVGVGQTLGSKWAWALSTYHPIKSRLPTSGFELPKQWWFGLSHYIPF